MGVLGKKGGFMCVSLGAWTAFILWLCHLLGSWSPLSSQSGKEMGEKECVLLRRKVVAEGKNHSSSSRFIDGKELHMRVLVM